MTRAHGSGERKGGGGGGVSLVLSYRGERDEPDEGGEEERHDDELQQYGDEGLWCGVVWCVASNSTTAIGIL